jgi:hypothetical protein
LGSGGRPCPPHQRCFGRSVTMDFELTESDPPRSFRYTVSQGGKPGKTTTPNVRASCERNQIDRDHRDPGTSGPGRALGSVTDARRTPCVHRGHGPIAGRSGTGGRHEHRMGWYVVLEYRRLPGRRRNRSLPRREGRWQSARRSVGRSPGTRPGSQYRVPVMKPCSVAIASGWPPQPMRAVRQPLAARHRLVETSAF